LLFGNKSYERGDCKTMTENVLSPIEIRKLGCHPYPIQIAEQTRESIKASVLYFGLLGTATNQYLKYPWALWTVRRAFKISDESWKRALDSIFRRDYIFKDGVLQNGVLIMISQWDWYIRRIGKFILFSHEHNSQKILTDKQKKDLLRIGWIPGIEEQTQTIQTISNVPIDLPETSKSQIKEMCQVRNLGMHNNWEVDETYKNISLQKENWFLGQFRKTTLDEVEQWEIELLKLVNRIATLISARYGEIPDYSYP
jgi:hypothetical protein